jgi:hypothetical protein
MPREGEKGKAYKARRAYTGYLQELTPDQLQLIDLIDPLSFV